MRMDREAGRGGATRTVLKLRPRPGLSGAVIELFRREGIIDRALLVDGCHRVEIWQGADELLVVGTWADAGAYQAWLEHPARSANNDELDALLLVPVEASSPGGLFELALSGGGSGGEQS
ncbi:MAG: antibiotic biosynthesis monooxygenase [bacterium]|nr:antibiotic biosynthesis monooxygenase [bacterium]